MTRNNLRTGVENIRSLFEATGVSCSDICRDTGISYKTISQVMQGNSRPSLDLVLTLADYFAVPLDFVVGRHDKKTAEAIMTDYPKHFTEVRRCAYEEYLHAQRDTRILHIDGYVAPYPYSLASVIIGKPVESILTQDQLAGMDEALKTLNERTRNMILRYFRDGVTLDTLVAEYGVTRERVRQIIARGCRTLRYPALRNMVIYGKAGSQKKTELEQLHRELTEKEKSLEEWSDSLNQFKSELDNRMKTEIPGLDHASSIQETPLRAFPLEKMDLSVRSYNVLHRNDLTTLEKIVGAAKCGKLLGLRNLGKKCYEEITSKIEAITGSSFEELPW